MSSTMRVLPATKMAKAAKADPAIKATMADAPRNPMPVEMSAPAPACIDPSNAEALPASLEKGASPSAAAFGAVSPMESKKKKNRTSIAGRPTACMRVPAKKTSPVKV